MSGARTLVLGVLLAALLWLAWGGRNQPRIVRSTDPLALIGAFPIAEPTQ